MNCLYIFRGTGNVLPQFSDSSIWMYGKEYKPPDPVTTGADNSNSTISNSSNSMIDHKEGTEQDEEDSKISSISSNSTISTESSQFSSALSTINDESMIVIKDQTPSSKTINESFELTDISDHPNLHQQPHHQLQQQQQPSGQPKFITEFLNDFSHRIWFSYRQGFPYIGDTLFENDCGWGCMLRSGQMLLSNVLAINQVGKEWKKNDQNEYPESIYNIVRMFLDKPTAPFSIHNIALHGQNHLGKNVGEWFAPSNITHAIKSLVNKFNLQCNISVVISEDGSLYVDQMLDAALQPNGNWLPLLILIPTKLGVDTINQLYYQPLLELYTFPQSLGIVGGRPRASLYFIAAQDDNLFYLDPHTSQQAVDSEVEFSLSTFFCNIPKKANISEVDPSLVIPFFCRTKEDFLDFLERSKKLVSKSEFPLYNIAERMPDYQLQKTISIDGDEEDSSDDIDFEMEYHML